ncbi:MAG TPA: NeuD/PglB/VioB family sugar acetyltransferase [Steroidobacteraceae bacterium]|nr:NeuD/PglB/VioB family sugar acetyltransferase [Steroidobacteraceae bacterium]
MSRESILLIGAGGHALACIDVVEADGRFEIAGLVGSAAQVGESVLGHRVLGTDADLPALRARVGHALVAVGQIKTHEPRRRIFEQLRVHGFDLPVIVSPRAYVSAHARVGAGSIVMHGAVVNARAAVGENCILNSLSLIEHGATVDDHCHVSTGALVNGGAHVGACCFIGSGAAVREGVTVGEGSIIGMGQQVLRSCAAGSRLPQVAGA